jgi:hypothetical protein
MNDELHIGVLLPTGKAQWGEGQIHASCLSWPFARSSSASPPSGSTTRCSVRVSRVCRCSRHLRRLRVGSSLAPRP